MSFLELLLGLLLLAVGLLLPLARRLGLPYPTLLAASGVLIALLPGAPTVGLEPATALTLFIAPALVAAGYEFPLREARRLVAPLAVFAVVAVVATALAVAVVGHRWGLPWAAALALGAMVAPPDAAAATAVLSFVALPRDTDTVLRGESLFNDAVALLLFEGALAVAAHGRLDRVVLLDLALAAPLGVGLGAAVGWAAGALFWRLAGTLGGTLAQFVVGMLVWVAGTRLHVSAALAVVAFALVVARRGHRDLPAAVRVHSGAVWNTAVFVLNVVAFLLMGMQAKGIVAALPAGARGSAAAFAGAVLAVVVGVRLLVVVGFNRGNAGRHRRRGAPEPATLGQALVVGWAGMRGLVTLAAALALPADFPQRASVVLAAFGVVLGTLGLQGATLLPLIRALRLPAEAPGRGLEAARRALAGAGLAHLDQQDTAFARELGAAYGVALAGAEPLARFRAAALAALGAERRRLHALARAGEVATDVASALEQELDLRELSLQEPDARRVVDG